MGRRVAAGAGNGGGNGPDAAPSDLTATAVSITSIQLDWLDNSSDEDGFKIERSTDGTNFSQIDTVAAGVTTYTDTGLTGDVTYYYRVRGHKGSENSAYTNTVQKRPSYVLLDELYAWWKLDEASGDRAESHREQDLTDVNTVGGAAGKQGNAADFVRGNDELLQAAWSGLDTGDIDFTLSGWVFLDNNSDTQHFFAKDHGSGNREYRLAYVSATGRFRWLVFDSSNGVAGDVSADTLGAPSTGTWYFIEVWHDAANNEVGIRVNGGTADTAATSAAGSVKTTADVTLGDSKDGTGNFSLDGRMDEWAFWKRLLTTGEHDFLYNSGSGRSFSDIQPTYQVEETWDVTDAFSKTGMTIVRYISDVDGDGTLELVCNPGNQAHIAALKPDGTIEWENIINTNVSIPAYFPKVKDGFLYYGDRDADKVYKIDLSDGTKTWESAVLSGLVAMDISDQGVVVGYGSTLDVLDYSDGSSIGGNFPVATGITVHEQTVIAGDLDGDGNDEFFCCDNSGTIKGFDDDGTALLTISSDHTHVDKMAIGDFYSGHAGNELMVVVDDDNSAPTLEGDEVALYDSGGTQLKKYTTGASDGVQAIAFSYRDIVRVFWVAEDEGTAGLVDGELAEQWKVTGIAGGGAGTTSQSFVADLDGDGIPELFTNSGEDNTAGWWAFDIDGTYLYRATGNGWDLDPVMDASNGAFQVARDEDGDSWKEMLPGLLKSSESAENNLVYMWGNGES